MSAPVPKRREQDIQVFVPGLLHNYANGRVHWRTESNYRKRWRTATYFFTRAWSTTAPPELPKHVHLDAQTFNRFDDDGLRNACKPVVDGLVDAGVLHSDGPESGHHVTYSQAINRQARGVGITITARTP